MKKKLKYRIDYLIVAILLLFLFISVIAIYSSTKMSMYIPINTPIKQVIWYSVGILLIIIIMSLRMSFFYKYAYVFYSLGIILLILLLFFAKPVSNSKCWFVIPGIGNVQPSEFVKISLLIVISKITDNFNSNKHYIKDELVYLIKVFLIVIIPSILTFMQPDTGAVIMYLVIALSIVFASGIRIRWFAIASCILLVLVGIFLFLYFKKSDIFINIFGSNFFYRMDRILDWKNGSGMQFENASIAIGSAGLFGHGIFNTPIYFPEAHTDFIFAVYSSNFGLVGSIIMLFLFFVFDGRIISIGINSNNRISKFVIFGITGLLLFQQLQNIGMTIGLLPIMGITLPFISYGGSSLLSYMFLIGFVFAINNEKNAYK